MDNDKWLCTAEIFDRDGGGFGFRLIGPDGALPRDLERDFIVAAEALKMRLGQNLTSGELKEMFKPHRLTHTTPTDPKTT